MFELMLMRHAKSDWQHHTADIDRPLNKRGVQDAATVGAYLARQDFVPDKMIVSSARRTQQTAELMLHSFSLAKENVMQDSQLYLADMDTLCATIELYAEQNTRLLLLAHNPGMDYLVSHLAGTQATFTDSGALMTTCAIACFALDSLHDLTKPANAKLQKIIRPKEIVAVL